MKILIPLVFGAALAVPESLDSLPLWLQAASVYPNVPYKYYHFLCVHDVGTEL